MLNGIAVIGLAIFYPIIVKSDIPVMVVVAVILFQGASGVINYFFQGKFKILLRVDGRGYKQRTLILLFPLYLNWYKSV